MKMRVSLGSHKRCVNCGTTSSARWSSGYAICNPAEGRQKALLCSACRQRWEKKLFCHWCKYVYFAKSTDDAYIGCDHCKNWVHLRCEAAHGFAVDLKAADYKCPTCRGEDMHFPGSCAPCRANARDCRIPCASALEDSQHTHSSGSHHGHHHSCDVSDDESHTPSKRSRAPSPALSPSLSSRLSECQVGDDHFALGEAASHSLSALKAPGGAGGKGRARSASSASASSSAHHSPANAVNASGLLVHDFYDYMCTRYYDKIDAELGTIPSQKSEHFQEYSHSQPHLLHPLHPSSSNSSNSHSYRRRSRSLPNAADSEESSSSSPSSASSSSISARPRGFSSGVSTPVVPPLALSSPPSSSSSSGPSAPLVPSGGARITISSLIQHGHHHHHNHGHHVHYADEPSYDDSHHVKIESPRSDISDADSEDLIHASYSSASSVSSYSSIPRSSSRSQISSSRSSYDSLSSVPMSSEHCATKRKRPATPKQQESAAAASPPVDIVPSVQDDCLCVHCLAQNHPASSASAASSPVQHIIPQQIPHLVPQPGPVGDDKAKDFMTALDAAVHYSHFMEIIFQMRDERFIDEHTTSLLVSTLANHSQCLSRSYVMLLTILRTFEAGRKMEAIGLLRMGTSA